MIDVQGTSLTAEDKELLSNPLVGGLILFTRNYHSPAQITDLTNQIRQAAGTDILIAVDHEGGRVQRFREHFSAIPAMYSIWQKTNEDFAAAKHLAFHAGQLMAMEVNSVGIDISFAPVLDINNISEVIGDRAFHSEPDMVAKLALAFIHGMNSAGMKSTGKHFPGHGSVKEDSHIALPIDRRDRADILGYDMQPFRELIAINALDAIMPAHVIYPEIDADAVGFSSLWLQNILRKELGFDGVIFSDDLSMEGAACVGGFVERAESAQSAGCDMLLVCNNRNAAVEIIDNANISIQPQSSIRLRKMLSKTRYDFSQLPHLSEWQIAQAVVNS